MKRRTKIVCTLGPAVASDEGINQLVDEGMNVARLNFSHGTHDDHAENYRRVRDAEKTFGRAVGILADLQGPKIRLGTFAEGEVTWANGETVRITVEDIEGSHDRVSTTYSNLANDARPGDRLLIDDGKVAVEVTDVEGDDVVATVTEGGKVSDHKGVSLPGMDISVPALSEKDRDDLRFALKLGVDMVALSFVRKATDVDLVREIMDEEGRRVPVIAKLEKPEAVDSLEDIVLAFDGMMVARGDLGVEVPLERVPLFQKRAVSVARENARPVIVATQMLDSMINNSRPTRAEASDVANAVLDGADAVMLSGETSVGVDPANVVRTMAKIVAEAERSGTVAPMAHLPRTRRGVVSFSARDIAERIGAKALVAFSESGDTVRRLARLRSSLPLLAFTPHERVRAQLSLSWGTKAFIAPQVTETDDMTETVNNELLKMDGYDAGDLVVIVAGSPPGIAGNTNMIHVHKLGDHFNNESQA